MLPKSNRYCGGFTLLEVMLVVVISVTAMMFAVPAFKKAQARAQYMDASGVLMELANATKMLIEENPDLSIPSMSFGSNTSFTTEPATLNGITASRWMQVRNYLSKVNFQNNKYKGYGYAFSTEGTSNCGSDCAKPNSIACMSNTTNQRIDAYKCVWISSIDGSLHNNETN